MPCTGCAVAVGVSQTAAAIAANIPQTVRIGCLPTPSFAGPAPPHSSSQACRNGNHSGETHWIWPGMRCNRPLESCSCRIWPTPSGELRQTEAETGFLRGRDRMTRLKSKIARAAIMAAGAAAMVAGSTLAASAQQQPQMPRGWFKVCSKQEDVDICNVQNIVVAESGQLLIGLSLIDLKGKVNRRVFQVTVPSGRMLPPGIGMQIDG